MTPSANDAASNTEAPPRPDSGFACMALLVLSALSVVGLVAYCIAKRLVYPYELEWMEGCFVDHAQRAAAGRPLYAAPSAEFVPLLYTPLSHWFAGGLIRAGLGGFAAVRVVSLLGIAGATLIGTALAARASAQKWTWLAVPALVAAAYTHVNGYFDVGRPDNLLTLFAVAMLAGLAAKRDAAAAILLALGAAGALLTKQSSAAFVGIVLLAAMWRRPRPALIGAGVAVLIVAGMVIAMDADERRWLYTYAVDLPRAHTLTWEGLAYFIRFSLLRSFLPILLTLLGVLAAKLMSRASEPARNAAADRAAWSLLVGTVAALAYSAASCVNAGTAKNVHVVFAVVGACFVPAALARGASWLHSAAAERLVLLVLGGVMLFGLFDPRPCIPTQADRQAWTRYRQSLAAYGGPESIWTPYHAAAMSDTTAAPMRPHTTALRDYLGGFYGRPAGREPPADLLRLIRSHAFAAIAIGAGDKLTRQLVEPHYRRLTDAPRLRVPEFSGWQTDEEEMWVPASSSSTRAPDVAS